MYILTPFIETFSTVVLTFPIDEPLLSRLSETPFLTPVLKIFAYNLKSRHYIEDIIVFRFEFTCKAHAHWLENQLQMYIKATYPRMLTNVTGIPGPSPEDKKHGLYIIIMRSENVAVPFD